MFNPSKISLFCCLSATTLSPLLAADVVEFGSVDLKVSDDWVSIDLVDNYTTPIIAAGSITRNDEDSVVAQVRNVTATSFEIRLVDWGTSGLHTETETVSFIAIEQGRHEIGGVVFEAGKKDDFGALPFVSNNQTGFHTVTFDPIIKQDSAEGAWNFSAVSQIVGDIDPSAIHCRHDYEANWTSTLKFRFEQAQDDTSEMAISELHYIAVQAGSGETDNGVPFKSFSTEKLYQEIPKDLHYGASYAEPLVYGRMPSISGGDSTALRITEVGDLKLTAYADEATGWNKKHATEHAAVLVVGAASAPEGGDGDLVADSLTAISLDVGNINTDNLEAKDVNVENVNISGGLGLNDLSGSPFTVNVEDLKALSERSFETLSVGLYPDFSDAPVFAVGNGTSDSIVSSLLSVLPSGKTKISNPLWLDNSSVDFVNGLALEVAGHTELKGKVIISEPQGDISPGIYQ